MRVPSEPTARRLVGIVVATGGVAGTYALDPAPTLAVFVGVSFGIGAWLTLRNYAIAPGLSDSGWRHGRWNGLAVGVTTAAALVGVQPLFDSIRGLTLPFLVIGVGFAAVQCGVASVLDTDATDTAD
ncbi:sterol desaturase [Natronomonas gomsonensis]|uniref:sterol desaturase n=1 Tax=Natronomonas gomsonensis TaxID=1046043 RepID=UPI0015BD968C|nr:sterol desaturase [Natronomonas gomsonensis]